MSHANAALTPRGRLRLARLIVDEGWPVARAVERYEVSWPTAKRWATRYRRHGVAGMADRSSRPHHSPAKTPQPLVRKIVHVRLKQRLGPVQIAGRLGVPASTVHAVLTRCRLNRLSYLHGSIRCSSSTDKAMLASSGGRMPPCGVPVVVLLSSPSSVNPGFQECLDQCQDTFVLHPDPRPGL